MDCHCSSNCYWAPFAESTAFFAASPKSIAVMIPGTELRISIAASLLVPSRRTTRGTLIEDLAATRPSAMVAEIQGIHE